MNPNDPTTGAVVAPAPRRLFRLPEALQARDFRRFWVGETVSLFGDQATLIALPLVGVLALHASAAQMGYLGAALLFPNLLFSLHAGAWVDRRGRRREMMIFTALGRAAALATIPIAYAFGVLTLTQLYVASFLIGTLSVLFYVSYTHALRLARPARALPRGELAAERQPRLLVRRRPEPRRRCSCRCSRRRSRSSSTRSRSSSRR